MIILFILLFVVIIALDALCCLIASFNELDFKEQETLKKK